MTLEFKTPFDDDSHTLHDGPLQRFFRMRKWFFVVGALLLVLDKGWWDFAALARTVALDGLRADAVQSALTLTGLYLLLQAALVTAQIVITYRETIESRVELINSRRARELRASAEELLKGIDRDLITTARELSGDAIGKHNRLPASALRSQHIRQIGKEYAEEIDKAGDITQTMNERGSGESWRKACEQVGIAPASYGEHEAAITILRAEVLVREAQEVQEQGSARIVIFSEVTLDMIRIIPTLAILVYGLILHGDLRGLAHFM